MMLAAGANVVRMLGTGFVLPFLIDHPVVNAASLPKDPAVVKTLHITWQFSFSDVGFLIICVFVTNILHGTQPSL